MILAIAILSLIGFVLKFLSNLLVHEKFDMDLITATIVVLAWWNICLPVSITVIVLTVFIGILGAIYND
jgi:hypothetical protein